MKKDTNSSSAADDENRRNVEIILSMVFFTCSFVFGICGIHDLIISDRYIALYKFIIATLSVSAACSPFAAVQIALGRVNFSKSTLPYAKFSKLFLVLAVLLSLVCLTFWG